MNATTLTFRLKPEFAVESVDDGVLVRAPWGDFHISVLPEVSAALAVLGARDVPASGLAGLVIVGDPLENLRSVAAFAQLTRILDTMPLLTTRSIVGQGGTVLRLVALSEVAPRLGRPGLAGLTVSMPRFSFLRMRSEFAGLCLESPNSLYVAELGEAGVSLMARLAANPISADACDEDDRPALELLVAAGLLAATAPGEEEEQRLATWSFHDLLFHAHSRQGRNNEPAGATFRHRDRFPMPPALAESHDGDPIDLAVPAFDEVVARDHTLTEVMESRVSVRTYDEEAISLGELAEFLYRTARTRNVVRVESIGVYDGADRPYPTGGMAGDLEVYVSVARCEGLEPGIYHYESGAHRLRRIADSASAEPLLHGARTSSGGAIEPQLLLTLTSRFARLAWKYDAIAYAATLKHVGVFYQTAYLVATAMGLGPCALGTGNTQRAMEALGLDWLVESSVGEFALGSRPDDVRWVEGFTDMLDVERAMG